MNCRHCHTTLIEVFCDLHTCPPSNAMIKQEDLLKPEVYFPLKVYTCTQCWLVQVEEIEKAENIFNSEYTYFSSYSSSWLEHAKHYTESMIERFGFTYKSNILEIASNDGYLLQYFHARGIPVLGVEPTANTAQIAQSKGIDTIVDFFGTRLANERLIEYADLIIGNNVLAHVPDINDFVCGVKIALKSNGIATFEFPHLCKLIELNQFDTIYHEHFSYLSLTVVNTIFETFGLELFDVEEIPTHGGSLRIYLKHAGNSIHKLNPRVKSLLNKEFNLGIASKMFYQDFQDKVNKVKYEFLDFLIKQQVDNKTVIGYGAAAKGNTLLNFAGVKGTDLISFVSDASPFKQGKYLPGSRIPVVGIDFIETVKPDFIVIFPWNLKDEIFKQLNYTKSWGAKFVTLIPSLQLF